MAASLTFRTPRVIGALILREMNTTYGRSAFGYIWMVAEPVLAIALLTAVFSLVMRQPPIGTNFALFYATGMLPFTCYMYTQSKVAAAVNFSRQLLVYPRVTFFDAVVARFILNGMTQLLVAYLLFSILLLTNDTRAALNFPAIGLSYAMALACGFGYGSLNCVLFSMLPSYERVWAIMNRPMFILSGIFYMYEDVPDLAKDILWWNPLIHVVGMMRVGFYPTYNGDYISPAYVFATAAIPCAFGLFFLRRYHKKILNEL